jgi:hypothetical protein
MSWPPVTGHTAGEQRSTSCAMNENGHVHGGTDLEDIRLVKPDPLLGGHC